MDNEQLILILKEMMENQKTLTRSINNLTENVQNMIWHNNKNASEMQCVVADVGLELVDAEFAQNDAINRQTRMLGRRD